MTHPHVGSYLAQLRRVRRLSQGQVASALGLQRSAVCKLEHGSRTISARRLSLWLDLVEATEAERLHAFALAAERADTHDLRAAS